VNTAHCPPRAVGITALAALSLTIDFQQTMTSRCREALSEAIELAESRPNGWLVKMPWIVAKDSLQRNSFYQGSNSALARNLNHPKSAIHMAVFPSPMEILTTVR